MSARSRAVTKDEELGKRDDDYDFKATPVVPFIPRRWRKRLIIAGVIVAFFLLGRHLLAGPESLNIHDAGGTNSPPSHGPAIPPPRDRQPGEEEGPKHVYNGAVKYPALGKSLRSIARTAGLSLQHPNVLFASSIKSMSNLIPMACEMANASTNSVHLALFGRSSLSLEEVLSINGVEDSCRVHWHDARPTYAEHSSDFRDESAITGAMKHIHKYISPQAVIVDDIDQDETPFSKTIRKASEGLGISLIEIPSGRYWDFLWITKLDAQSLANWHRPNINIVIRALPGSSGSLLRLLKSLANADYRGLRVPALTIELPSQVDTALAQFLAAFPWPRFHSPSASRLLNVRHRISTSQLSPELSALRFVELFYPSHADHDNVLVLSPQAEVHPLFLHYLYYHVLGYRYSIWSGSVAGLSLDIPTTTLDGNGTIRVPDLATIDESVDRERSDANASSPFLYYAPSSAATLFFGDAWATFHDFLSKRIQLENSKTKKDVSESEPAWMEYLLELMKVRGWNVLHPSTALVTVHNDLARMPEEFQQRTPSTETRREKPTGALQEDAILTVERAKIPNNRTEHDINSHHLPLHQLLPFDGELQQTWAFPRLQYDGLPATGPQLVKARDQALIDFRRVHGNCNGTNATRPRLQWLMKTDDLFCLPGVEMMFADEEREVADEEPEIEEDWLVTNTTVNSSSLADSMSTQLS
ncbi:unnamed protein product [Zymoseptoria tritici ST99CH_1A5]|uniref:Glycosyltransferase 2 n=3 Tax=Zymoseptoria tritici TaxID=1047171 RepID=A0A2H1GYJ0_ZYMTR|nr:unnamed protein product [Zymoseptoria tritici ST99CH_1E4]SMR61597.1 unnamed protein product [Zymoseptoria tritici ST99CH_3D1]SMY27809.1 unnamed protein product [Zymoseptoria tritici ST99CH_1A5]